MVEADSADARPARNFHLHLPSPSFETGAPGGRRLSARNVCGAILAAGCFLWKAIRGGLGPRVDGYDVSLAVLLVATGTVLYAKGSPMYSGEDQIHISVVRRLAYLANPAIDNIYLSPNTIYTYP